MNSIPSMIENQPTLVHVLKARAVSTPDKTAYIFLEDGEDKEVKISYAELDLRARRLAAVMQQKNPQIHNSRVLLIYPQGIEFLITFFGSLYAGATAVLVSPPTSKKTAARLNGIVEDCDIAFILSTGKNIERMNSMEVVGSRAGDVGKFATLEWINTEQLAAGSEDAYTTPVISVGHIAFLQYTSGSTGTPKGVMVSHSNLMANQRSIKKIYNNDASSVFVSWLPLIHDMGLIGKALQPMYLGVPLIFMSPLHFVQKPFRWLRAIHKYRGTLSGGPNFAFDLCVNKVTDEELRQLDLSCWKSAFNGSEPVRSATVQRFIDKFSACNLPADAYMAVYGLAEATLIVSGTERGKPIQADSQTNYMPSGIADSCDVVKVVDPDSHVALADGEEGEIWVHGPSVAQGYWNQPQATAETFQATLQNDKRHFLRTGDTGFIRQGNVHITGRIKDIIIVQGKNFHAEDIEWSTNELAGIRPGCCVAFSVTQDGPEQLIIVAGALQSDAQELEQLAKQIRSGIYADHQLHVHRVLLIKPKDLPTTTSGKVQRRLCRQMYLNAEFAPLLDHQAEGQGITSDPAEQGEFVPALSATERDLAAVWGEILNMPAARIGMNDNFFELGGSSLTMLELATRLNVSMELLFRYPTINGYLYRTSEYEFPDVASDIYLPPLALDSSLQGKTGVALITGGTGFFGLHFLQAMMARTKDRFVLMVRGGSEQVIQKKFDDAVAYFKMEHSIDKQRVTLVQGDLSQKQLGIAPAQYSWLLANVDKIFHIGSHVNNWLPYEGIREINVDGTRSLLELARTGRKKEFHYTSTSTFSPDKDDQAIFLEQDDIKLSDINRYFGYDISKYASEQLCKLARQEGIVCNIYRLVWVGGHLDTGLTKVGDGFNIMLRILLTIGAYPQGNYLHDVVPVDLMADAMASLIGKADNTNYNVTSQSKESIDMKRIAVMLRSMGYKLDEVSRGEFVERLRNYPLERWDEQCKSYRQLVIRLFEDPTPKVESFYDSANFLQQIDPTLREKMSAKFIDSWFEKTVNFLVRNNALPTTSGLSYAGEMQKIAQWNKTEQRYPKMRGLHQMFARQAVTTPTAAAVIFGNKTVSYAELDTMANKVALNLLRQGVQRHEFVGLALSRSIELIAGILGILKAGAAYVPLDPTYPSASLDYMIADSNCRVLLVDELAKQQLVAHREKWLDIGSALSSDMEKSAAQLLANTDAAASDHDLAYMIYTSGTTGNPKGVLVEHRSVLNHNFSIIKAFELTTADKVLQFSTVNFDSFIEEVFPTLFAGATLVMLQKEQLTDVQQLQQIIVQHKVSVLKFSTAYWHSISELNVEKLGVRLVAIGGEEADVQHYKLWRRTNPAVPLINTYGPTETTVTATLSRLEGMQNQIDIGKPIANTQIHILDAQLQPVPIGFAGDMYIAGDGVSRGYLNRPRHNADAFVDNPFAPGNKMYKSGDIAHWNNSGNLVFLGRSDNQVKVRGYRIELGAIESVLGSHPELAQVAVVLKQVGTKKKIAAYFSSRNPALTALAVRNFVEQKLPSYMIPNLLLPLEQIPLNPNGKIDRQRLITMPVSGSANIDYSVPDSPNQVKMAAIWESLLHINQIGLNDDFFDLGGHSLLVMSLLTEIDKQFGVQLPVHAIFDHPTIVGLTAYIETHCDGIISSNLVRFPQMAVESDCTARQSQPLFMVHGLGGHLASFYPLIKNLQQSLRHQYNVNITTYGLEAKGFKDGETCFANLDEMVDHYVTLIQQTQPQGPYLIGGWSYGVSVAFHIVQELIARGEQVSAFISIDAEAPKVPKDFEHFISSNSVLDLDDLYQPHTLQLLLDKFGRRFGFVSDENECAKQQFYRFLGYSRQDSPAQIERYSKIAIANIYNARDFKPSRINPINTLLVRASKSCFDNYISDWHGLLESKMLSSLTLNGDHWSIMQDPELAAHLARHVVQSVEPQLAHA